MQWNHLLQEYWYTLAVLGVGVWVVWSVRGSLERGEIVTKAALAARKGIQAVPTNRGMRPTDEVKKRGAKSIEQRFTVTRRLVLPLITLAILALAALPFLDMVPAAAVSMVVAVATVVLGVAARPGLENAVSGLVMSYSKVLRLGDTVLLDGYYGTVEDISSTHTTIRIWDSRRYVVPNSQTLQSKLVNYTLFDQQIWACVEFWVAYDADLDIVREMAIHTAATSAYKVGEQVPSIWVIELEQQAIKCWLAAWTENAAEAWSFTDDVRTRLTRRFREAGISSHGFRYMPTPPFPGPQPGPMPDAPKSGVTYIDGNPLGETAPAGIEVGARAAGSVG